jgi:hypothetical protein
MYNYTLSMLEDIRGRNSDAGESNSRVVDATSFHITMYNCDRYAGANQALNSIVYNLVHNRFVFTVNLENPCWFCCISYLKYQKVLGEHRNTHDNALLSCSFNSTICKIEEKLKNMSLRKIIQISVLLIK